MSATNALLDLALQLPAKDRAVLANQLLLSLEPDDGDADHEALWQTEIAARLARVEKGNYTASEWHEALARVRQSLVQGTTS